VRRATQALKASPYVRRATCMTTSRADAVVRPARRPVAERIADGRGVQRMTDSGTGASRVSRERERAAPGANLSLGRGETVAHDIRGYGNPLQVELFRCIAA